MRRHPITKRTRHTGTVEERFWFYVKKTETCWIWTAALDHNGYGLIQQLRPVVKNWLAHRLSWTIHNGPIPDGLSVLHNCPDGDNPMCVNPAHLWLGTQGDNVRDMDNKGRRVNGPSPGERNGYSKMTSDIVILIRSRYAAGGISQQSLGAEYGVTKSTVNKILRGRSWTHIP